VYKLLFFYICCIFAVLLPDLSRLSCHSVQRMFWKKNTRHQAHKPTSQQVQLGPDFRNGMVKRVKLRQRAKFRGDRSNRPRDMAIFRFFQDGGRLPSWICYVCVRTTHEGHLVAFIAVQNLVGIGALVSIICMFFSFASLAWKRLFMPPKLSLGILPPKWGAMSTKPKKAHPCASPRHLSHHAQKSVDASDL